MDNAVFSENVKKLEEAAGAWAEEVLPKIVEDESGIKIEAKNVLPPVEEVKDSAEAWARRTGEEKALEETKARRTIDLYSRR